MERYLWSDENNRTSRRSHHLGLRGPAGGVGNGLDETFTDDSFTPFFFFFFVSRVIDMFIYFWFKVP